MGALVVALGVALWLPIAAQSAEESAPAVEKPVPSAEKSATAAKCLEAAVNPVTGYAICVNPRGARSTHRHPKPSSLASPARTMTTPSPCMSTRLDAAIEDGASLGV
jgi:uncharacterized protein (DUF2342 family)